MEINKEKNPKRKWVKDDQGQQYQLREKLGQGGQGVVLHTQHPQVLVKLSKPLSHEKKEHAETHLKWLQRQPLESLNIARPLSLILEQNRAGYVMELMDGLIPLTQSLEETINNGSEGFLKSGGLLRRIKVLAKLARTLAQLHGRGLAYGDLSPDNIFVSEDPLYSEVWLIDCDNICYHSRSSEVGVYTPDYGAPEIMQGISGITSYSDSWSFAVIAYQLLTMNHPLKGDMVNDGDPELEEQALQGKFPWVGHPEDASNACNSGIADNLVFGKNLLQLMDQCFRQGLNNPDERPTLSTWAEAFEEATHAILICEECDSSFYFNTHQQCSFCDHQQQKNKAHLFNEYIWFPEDSLPEDTLSSKNSWLKTGRFIVLQPGLGVFDLNKEQDDCSLTPDDLYPLCKLDLNDKGLRIDPDSNGEVRLQNDKKTESIRRKTNLKVESQNNQDLYLHLGSMDTPHPVWRFRW